MERDLESGAQDINFIHFNSHAHVERDAKEYLQNAYKIISTHTLTWSVTHTNSRAVWVNVNFNSHAHVERDTPGGGSFFSFIISTHTLTWSVTLSSNFPFAKS